MNRKLEKAEKELQVVQKGCTARTYDIDDVKKAIEVAEEEAQKLPHWTYKHIVFKQYQTVSKSYNNRAESTVIKFDFTTKGAVKSIEISRQGTTSEPYGGEIRELQLLKEAFEEKFEQKINERLAKYLYQTLGFTFMGRKEV